ncbi:MAG: hypothetical protein AAF335_02030, partial [Bacteroidota bacterium]
ILIAAAFAGSAHATTEKPDGEEKKEAEKKKKQAENYNVDRYLIGGDLQNLTAYPINIKTTESGTIAGYVNAKGELQVGNIEIDEGQTFKEALSDEKPKIYSATELQGLDKSKMTVTAIYDKKIHGTLTFDQYKVIDFSIGGWTGWLWYDRSFGQRLTVGAIVAAIILVVGYGIYVVVTPSAPAPQNQVIYEDDDDDEYDDDDE